MNLIGQLLNAVIISSVTSTLLIILWYLFRSCFMALNPKLGNILLRIVYVSFFVPIGYVAILLMEYRWLQGKGAVWKLYFARTRVMNKIIHIIIVAWMVIVGVCILKYFIQHKILFWKLQDNIPIEEGLSLVIFQSVCRRMGISEGAVSLQRNPLIDFPIIVSAYHPKILLPEQEYTEEELEMIFFHELSHYKHSDLKWNVIVMMITILQCVNPFVFLLVSINSFWNECLADASAVEFSGNSHHLKKYFFQIEKAMLVSTEIRTKKFIKMPFNKNKTMVKRVRFVNGCRCVKKCNKRTAILLVVVALLVSVIISTKVGVYLSDLHKYVYKLTENDCELYIASGSNVENFADVEEANYQEFFNIVSKTEPIVVSKDFYRTECKVASGEWQIMNSFKAKAGQRVDVNVGIRNCGIDYQIGILDSDGHICYVQANGSVSHNFDIIKTDTYCVFIQNNCRDKDIPYMSINLKLFDND